MAEAVIHARVTGQDRWATLDLPELYEDQDDEWPMGQGFCPLLTTAAVCSR